MTLVGLDHVQIAIPPDGEASARRFYRDVLGMSEVAKPTALVGRGDCWFTGGGVAVHLGVEDDFRPARKAHPAFLVADLTQMVAQLEKAGRPVTHDELLPGYERAFTQDPFGNRIELMQKLE